MVAATAAEVVQLLIEAEVPVSRVNTIADIFEDQHYRARDMLMRVPHPTLSPLTMTGVVPKLSRTPGHIEKAGSDLGADTREVLMHDLGLTCADIDRLIESGAVWSPAEVGGAEPRP